MFYNDTTPFSTPMYEQFLGFFSFFEKKNLLLSYAMSVRPSVCLAVCPSVFLFRNSNCKLQIYAICNFFANKFVCPVFADLLTRFCWKLIYMYVSRWRMSEIIEFLVVFFFTEKTTLCCHSRCLSVRPSVCPSCVEISLERGCNITNKRIDLKFALIIGDRVMHVWKERFFEIRIASCKFMQFILFFVLHGFDKPLFSI